MNGTNAALLDLYNCCVCLEPMKTAVSLDPCGHELNEGCADAILSSTKKCPSCRVDVNSFKPSYNTRQAVETILQNMPCTDSVTIHVSSIMNKDKYTYTMKRDSKAIELFKRIFDDTTTHPSRVKLALNGKYISLFGHFSEYLSPKESEFQFHIIPRMGHWTHIADDYPLLFQRAVAEVGKAADPDTLHARFASIYEGEIARAMDSLK